MVLGACFAVTAALVPQHPAHASPAGDLSAVAPPDPGRTVQAGPAPTGKVDPQVRSEIVRGGVTTFWITFAEKADLRAAIGATAKPAKGALVRQTKLTVAERSQAGVRGLLARRKAEFTPYWIANTIRARGDAKLIGELAGRHEVAGILPDRKIPVPRPEPAAEQPHAQGAEWNVERVGAPSVWSEFGVRGAGVVVANIDTGVQFDHPALSGSYRGRRADGTFDHNYHWFDPSHVCPTAAPCDNNGHGTHTMGTMVGRATPDEIGVAPGATWIAAKGCEQYFCSTQALLAAGQWILAPTDMTGANPRPDLAPDVVNNSWGGSGFNPWYADVVDSWVAAGIFPAFANGNNGPACGTSGSPGVYSASYSSGAYDQNNAIAGFSSRGPGQNGEIKPNIAAPGVNVRSSVPGGGYAAFSGTSMASPHTAAAVALLWSAAPRMRGDVASTREVLDASAIDIDDRSCGGTAGDNNVWGEGRLDVHAAVLVASGPAGELAGVVASGGVAVAGAEVSLSGPVERHTTTTETGRYRFGWLPPGTYQVRVEKFGFAQQTRMVGVPAGVLTAVDFDLVAAPTAVLSGTVRSAGGPVPGAHITIEGTPLSTNADPSGSFRVVVPRGSYEVRIEPAGSCLAALTQRVAVTDNVTLDVMLPNRTDRFGHTCAPTSGGYLAGTELLPLVGDDQATRVGLPFPVRLYGQAYSQAWVSTNGVVSFGGPSPAFYNGPIPEPAEPNTALYPFWDDLYVDDQAGVYTAVVGDVFVVEWRNVRFYADYQQRLSISAAIGPDGVVSYRYRGLTGSDLPAGASATIGVENSDGTDALAYSVNRPVVAEGTGVTFRPPGGAGRNPYGPVEAEGFDAQSGVETEGCVDEGGGQNIRSVASGDWVRFDGVDFGDVPARHLLVRLASGVEGGGGGFVEVRLDNPIGPPVTEVAVGNTGGWQSWRTTPANVSGGVTGVHTVYLTFQSGQPSEFVNVNWFYFER